MAKPTRVRDPYDPDFGARVRGGELDPNYFGEFLALHTGLELEDFRTRAAIYRLTKLVGVLSDEIAEREGAGIPISQHWATQLKTDPDSHRPRRPPRPRTGRNPK